MKTPYLLLFSNKHFSFPLLFLFLFSTANIQAQQHQCGTVDTKADIENRKLTKENPDYQQFVADFIERKRNPDRSQDVLTSVPIKAHIIRQSNGTGGLTAQQLDDAMEIMNGIYVNANIQFFLCEGINYINSSTYYDFSQSEQSALTAAHQTDNVVNIYFANSVTSSSGSGLCGYAYYPGGPNVVVMANSCTRNGSTLSHELGHFFALPHTHNGGTELVDGSNCSFAGDNFCDTPADPRLSYSTVNSNCEYTGTSVDANGDLYAPNPRNLMSYSRKECRDFMSMEQYATMAYTLLTSRAYLQCPSFSVDFKASETENCEVPFTVDFTAQANGASTYGWDFNNDGIIDANDQDVSHTFNEAGQYDVRLTVANDTGDEIFKTRGSYITAGPVAIDYDQDFQSFINSTNASGTNNGWVSIPNNTSSEFRWNADRNGTPTGSTGPSFDHTTRTRHGTYVFTESSSGTSGDEAMLISPCITIPSDAGSPFLDFWYHMYGNSIGALHVDINTGTDWEEDVLDPKIGAQQSSSGQDYNLASLSLIDYIGQTIQVRFRAIRGSGNQGDIAIDDFKVYDNNAPSKISFTDSGTVQAESNESGSVDCRDYIDLQYQLKPTNIVRDGNAVVAINSDGTASPGIDYLIIDDTLRWEEGSFDEKTFTLRIFDDAAIETLETVNLSLDLSGNSTLVLDSSKMDMAISIQDNDAEVPNEGAVVGGVIERGDFENNALPNDWSSTQEAGSTGWTYGTPADLSSSYVTVPPDNRNYIAGSNDDACNCDASRDILSLPTIDLTNAGNSSFTFEYYQPGNYNSDGTIEFFFDGNNTDTPDEIIPLTSNQTAWQSYALDLEPYMANQAFRIQFVHNDNGGWSDGFFLDNVEVAGIRPLEVATVETASAQEYLGPQSVIYFFDETNNDIIARIENRSDWDYGCTTIEIDRVGTGAVAYIDDSPEFFLTEKNLLITPSNNNPNGSYNIRLYYRSDEISGWEIATGNQRDAMMLIKSGGSLSNVTPQTPFANGVSEESTIFSNGAFNSTHFYVDAQFDSGFSGFGGARGLGSVPLPVELLFFNGEKTAAGHHLLLWDTESERSSDFFEIQRSADGRNFEALGKTQAAGFSTSIKNYSFTDRLPMKGNNYYRLRQVDFDGSETYSAIINLENNALTRTVNVFPNPTRHKVQVEIGAFEEQSHVQLYNSVGQILLVKYFNGDSIIELDLDQFAKGVYLIEVKNGTDHIHHEKVIKQ